MNTDMTRRILVAAERLTRERGRIPSMNEVAAAAGVSKGGLIHHFSSRTALVTGLARNALHTVDEAMTRAAAAGTAAETWLRVSVPSDADIELFRALSVAHRALAGGAADIVREAADAIERWEALIAAEVGSAARARAIRLVGDGLLLNALAGIDDPALRTLEDLIADLLENPRR